MKVSYELEQGYIDVWNEESEEWDRYIKANKKSVMKEEKKIPEKLDYCEENTFMIKCKENSYLTREEMRLLDSNFKEIGNKINEIIDFLKSKGE